jgi:hypothetical protein
MWTTAQQSIIGASPSKRLLVDAGPGTGKTATACARVAWLIEECGIEPSQILMTSFTNAAVFEIRNRIAGFLTQPERAAELRVSTLDSFSWYLRIGFRNREIGFSNYEKNIEDAASLLRIDPSTREYLREFQHFILDEAQDVTGARVDLLLHLLDALDIECGVSIFSDDAQAIYGFSEDGNREFFGNTLPEEIRRRPALASVFEQHSLVEVHRTQDPKLKKLFIEGREMLLNQDDKPIDEIYADVRSLVVETNHQTVASAFEVLMDAKRTESLGSNPLMLFRRRMDALQAGHYLGATPRRMRLSGYPLALEPWIARCFWDWEKERISKTEFISLCETRLGEDIAASESRWRLLHDEAGTDENRLSVIRLANILSRPNVPSHFCLSEYGVRGPTLGTIHASKGREMENVVLFVPTVPNFNKIEEEQSFEKILEEARILFVAGTRAKNTLVISDQQGKSHFRKGGSLSWNDRAYTIKRTADQPQIAVEIGKREDVSAEGLVGSVNFPNQGDAILAQKALWRRREVTTPLKANLHKGEDWTYSVSIDYGYADKRYKDLLSDKTYESTLFYFERSVNSDIKFIGSNLISRNMKFRPPNGFRYFFSMGSRSLVLSSDNPQRERLHEPWRNSGFVLAPLLVGYPDLFLATYGARRR